MGACLGCVVVTFHSPHTHTHTHAHTQQQHVCVIPFPQCTAVPTTKMADAMEEYEQEAGCVPILHPEVGEHRPQHHPSRTVEPPPPPSWGRGGGGGRRYDACSSGGASS